MKISVDLGGINNEEQVVVAITNALGIYTLPHPILGALIDGIGFILHDSQLWRDEINRVSSKMTVVYPTESTVAEIFDKLPCEEKANLISKVEKDLEKRGIDKSGEVYAAILKNDTTTHIWKEEEDKWWSELVSLAPELQKLHLVLSNVGDFKNANRDKYYTLLEILDSKTRPRDRYDKVEFSFEIADESEKRYTPDKWPSGIKAKEKFIEIVKGYLNTFGYPLPDDSYVSGEIRLLLLEDDTAVICRDLSYRTPDRSPSISIMYREELGGLVASPHYNAHKGETQKVTILIPNSRIKKSMSPFEYDWRNGESK